MTTQYIVKDTDGTFYYKDKAMTIHHREDGPAIECSNGTKEWWLNDKQVSEEDHKRINSKEPKINIEGKGFTISELKELIAKAEKNLTLPTSSPYTSCMNEEAVDLGLPELKSNMKEIKPCPFCGSTNIDFKTKNGTPNCLVCEDCGCEGPEAHERIDNWEFSTIPYELIELWNKRK